MPRRSSLVLLASFLVLAGCADDPLRPDGSTTLVPTGLSSSLADAGVRYTGQYVILSQGSLLPADLEARISAAGGTLVQAIPQVGIAIAESDEAGFAERAAAIQGVQSVTADMVLPFTDPVESLGEMEAELVTPSGDLADGAFFYSFQWAPRAIQAPEAWEAGFTGAGVRIAILDGGVYEGHLDLAPNIDLDAARSFVPGQAWNTDTGTFWHGTHVAGIAAATGQAAVVGVAPNATIVPVKVLHNGSGSFAGIMNGILYAATPVAQGGGGAHIINMSLGATAAYRDLWHEPGYREAFRELEKGLDRVAQYAWNQGTTVIASAGNDGFNYDLSKELYKFPAESHGVIAVGSTAPFGWAQGATDYSRFGYYSDHGKSLLDVSAPGGSPELFFSIGTAGCSVAGEYTTVNLSCYAFDYVVSSIRGSTNSGTWVSWAYGTSMAAPAASGVAALIIEANGGSMNPRAVRSALQASSMDLGKPGQDEYYGHGWVNALRAVTR